MSFEHVLKKGEVIYSNKWGVVDRTILFPSAPYLPTSHPSLTRLEMMWQAESLTAI